MSPALTPPSRRVSIGVPFTGFFAGLLCVTGCTMVSSDVDKYYRDMAYNYREAQGKARMDVTALENQSKVLALTGENHQFKRAQHRVANIKAWEEKCNQKAAQFEKAAEWTEAHFHLPKPAIRDKPPGFEGSEDPAVQQAAAGKSP